VIEHKVKPFVREVPDFPRPGVLFRDLTPLLAQPELCLEIVDFFISSLDHKPDAVAGIESRGFWLGPLISQRLNVPFIPIRKKGKLPFRTIAQSYDLEYGEATVEIHTDAVKYGQRVLIHDDLIATGGSAAAAAELVKQLGGIVSGFAFLVELRDLKGRQKIKPYSDTIISLLTY
jgi:adenine phosphoribosyltransferase